jgi:hypothetical protein
LGADEIYQIVRGDDLEVVEEAMSTLPVSSGGCRPSRIAVRCPRGEARRSSRPGIGGLDSFAGSDVLELCERDSFKNERWSHTFARVAELAADVVSPVRRVRPPTPS